MTMAIKSVGWFLIGRRYNIISVYCAFQDFFKANMGKKKQKGFE
jgi:hypothetical protein